jgi:hypothetical protein
MLQLSEGEERRGAYPQISRHSPIFEAKTPAFRAGALFFLFPSYFLLARFLT